MSYQPPYRITPPITHLLAATAELLGEIKSLDAKLNTPKSRKKNQIRTITGTLQIEGNSFSEDKVTAVLEGKRVLGTPKELAEVQGAIAVYEQLPQYDCFKMKHLLKAHELMMGQILTHAGRFRSKAVGGLFLDLRDNVAQFISLYRQEGNLRGQSLKNKGEYTGH
jgi:Fic family protein